MGADQYAWYEIYPQFERVQVGDIFFANRRPFPKLRQRWHDERFTHCGMIWGQTVPAEYRHNQGEIRLHKAERMFVDERYLWWTHEATAWKGLVRGVAQPQRDFDETLVVLRARGTLRTDSHGEEPLAGVSGGVVRRSGIGGADGTARRGPVFSRRHPYSPLRPAGRDTASGAGMGGAQRFLDYTVADVRGSVDRKRARMARMKVRPYDEQHREWRESWALRAGIWFRFMVDWRKQGHFHYGWDPSGEDKRVYPQVFHPEISNQYSPDRAQAPPEGFEIIDDAKGWIEVRMQPGMRLRDVLFPWISQPGVLVEEESETEEDTVDAGERYMSHAGAKPEKVEETPVHRTQKEAPDIENLQRLGEANQHSLGEIRMYFDPGDNKVLYQGRDRRNNLTPFYPMESQVIKRFKAQAKAYKIEEKLPDQVIDYLREAIEPVPFIQIARRMTELHEVTFVGGTGKHSVNIAALERVLKSLEQSGRMKVIDPGDVPLLVVKNRYNQAKVLYGLPYQDLSEYRYKAEPGLREAGYRTAGQKKDADHRLRGHGDQALHGEAGVPVLQA